MTSKPTFVFVPGAWHGPGYFDLLRGHLSKHRYSSTTVTTPSVNSDPPVESMQSDVDAISSVMTSTLEDDNDVVLVMHSYAGMPGTEAAGQVVDDLKATDRKGTLRRLVYISAWVPLEGDVTMNPQEIVKDFHPVYHDFQGGSLVLNEKAMDWFYDESLPVDQQQEIYKSLGSHPISTFVTPVTRAGWRNVPSTFIYAQKDKLVPFPFAEWMVKRAQKQEAREGGVRAFSGELGEFSLDTAHCTMFLVPEKVEELGDMLIKAAKES